MSASENYILVDGVGYKAVKEINSCTGCAFSCDGNNYEALRNCKALYDYNGCEGIIWIKQEVKPEKEQPVKSLYNLAEITEAYREFIDNYTGSKELPEFIKEYFERKMQPEYQEYLRLKQKYEKYEQE
jgi:hypothetical protein